jgi:hypothetical protein
MAKPENNRVAYSPAEFAALFGKEQTWGYRQIYAGKVKTIAEHGRILIPAAEVDSILAKAGVYDGLKQPTKTKAEVKRLVSKIPNAWSKFIAARRKQETPSGKASVPRIGNSDKSLRKAAMDRLTKKR